jgi:hypothetical protein
MMKRTYVVSKDDDSGLWYAHMIDFPKIPVFGSFSKNKKAAQNHAAKKMGITLKEYYKTKIN